jgi:hypothetical protein
MNTATAAKSFYKNNAIYKLHNKNVVYLAYVGEYNKEPIYKYGVTSNVYHRDYDQHRKQFEAFQMCWVKKTYNMTQAEALFEKELKIRNLHKSLVIKNKRQTELFTVTPEYSFEYLQRLFAKISRHSDKDILDEIKQLKTQLRLKNAEIKALKAAQ